MAAPGAAALIREHGKRRDWKRHEVSVGPSQPAPSCPSRRPTLRSGHQSHRRRLGSDMYHVGVGNNAGEATRVCGLEGVERPPEYTQGASPPREPPQSTCMRRQHSEETLPQSPHDRPPQVSPAGRRDPATSTFPLAGPVREGNSGGYSCSGSWPLSYPGRAARPRTGRTELRPDLPMLTNINHPGITAVV